MTSPAKTTDSAAQAPAPKGRRDDGPARPELGNGASAGSLDRLDELARERDDLARQVREVAARELVVDGSDVDERTRTGRMLTTARAELLQELLREEQEQARRQLADAARSGEDAVAGVVRSVATIVRSVVPAALVRPEDLIEATFALADQGIRLGRSFVLTVTASARELTPIG